MCFSFDEELLIDDPIHKYESIPLESSENDFVKKQLNTDDAADNGDQNQSVNYAYHPIIDFFAQSYKSWNKQWQFYWCQTPKCNINSSV